MSDHLGLTSGWSLTGGSAVVIQRFRSMEYIPRVTCIFLIYVPKNYKGLEGYITRSVASRLCSMGKSANLIGSRKNVPVS